MHKIPCLDLWHNVLNCTGTFSMKTPVSILNMPGKRSHESPSTKGKNAKDAGAKSDSQA